MYVCMYRCIYVSMFLCMYVGMYVYVYVYVYVCVCMYVCTYVCMYVCTHVRMYGCTYVCMYVCTYVCMYVCMGLQVWCFPAHGVFPLPDSRFGLGVFCSQPRKPERKAKVKGKKRDASHEQPSAAKASEERLGDVLTACMSACTAQLCDWLIGPSTQTTMFEKTGWDSCDVCCDLCIAVRFIAVLCKFICTISGHFVLEIYVSY